MLQARRKNFGPDQPPFTPRPLTSSPRLWYQLTTTIEAFIAREGSGPFQIELYEQFIKDFASKLNQLKLASIGIAVARQFTGASAPAFAVDPSSLPFRSRWK